MRYHICYRINAITQHLRVAISGSDGVCVLERLVDPLSENRELVRTSQPRYIVRIRNSRCEKSGHRPSRSEQHQVTFGINQDLHCPCKVEEDVSQRTTRHDRSSCLIPRIPIATSRGWPISGQSLTLLRSEIFQNTIGSLDLKRIGRRRYLNPRMRSCSLLLPDLSGWLERRSWNC
jgi:hypothetical protein